MIREFHLADLFTLGNAASGILAILFSLLYMESGSSGHFFAAVAPCSRHPDEACGEVAHRALVLTRRGRADAAISVDLDQATHDRVSGDDD